MQMEWVLRLESQLRPHFEFTTLTQFTTLDRALELGSCSIIDYISPSPLLPTVSLQVALVTPLLHCLLVDVRQVS